MVFVLRKHNWFGSAVAGFCAGAVAGLFAAGGGMILIPLLTVLTDLDDREIFASSLSVILPICLVALAVTAMGSPLPWSDAFPYMISSAVGGILAGLWGQKIPDAWLHRGLGLLILWGGIRYLW